jgi:SAM-dependent methyltransferase
MSRADQDTYLQLLKKWERTRLSHPEKACAEACRVLKSGGKFGFTVWAGPEENPGVKIVNDAIEAHADLNVQLPEGPAHYLYGESEECRAVLEQAGFDGASMSYETRSVEWHLPTARYFFEAERDAGVRTAGLLARQSRERLATIRIAVEEGVKRYARGDEFVLPMAAHVVVLSKT